MNMKRASNKMLFCFNENKLPLSKRSLNYGLRHKNKSPLARTSLSLRSDKSICLTLDK